MLGGTPGVTAAHLGSPKEYLWVVSSSRSRGFWSPQPSVNFTLFFTCLSRPAQCQEVTVPGEQGHATLH